jgi:hemoglobin
MSSLYEKLGGQAAVCAAVEVFYEKVLSDPKINHYFANLDMVAQRKKQILFMTYAFGGPHQYEGKDMREAHKKLKGLNEDHFNAVALHLKETLIELQISADLIEQVLGIVGSTKNDVLQKESPVLNQI